MTEGTEGFPTDSNFFDQVFDENHRLFFEPEDVVEVATPEPAVDLDQSVAVAETLPAVTSDKPEASYNRSSNWKTAGWVGAVAVTCGGLLALAVEIAPPSRSQPKPTPSELSVSLTSLPKKLPAAVRARVGDVGIVDDEIYASQTIAGEGDDYTSSGWVNGVELRPNLATTGGDLFAVSSESLNSTTECQQVTFTTGLFRDFIADGFGTTSSSSAPKAPELEALGLPSQLDEYPYTKPLPNITIAAKPPKLGEDLFFVNYENETNGLYYGMYNGSGPAIYAGVYAGNFRGGNYDVLTGLKSYGHDKDTSSKDGSEDGAVFNEEGQLVGLSLGWSTNPATVKQYEKWDGEELTGTSSHKVLSDSAVEPLTKSEINKYDEKQQPIVQDCFPEAMAS